MNRKKKICRDCNEEHFIWAYGRCKYCDTTHKARTPKEYDKTGAKAATRKLLGSIKGYSDTNGYWTKDNEAFYTSRQIENKVKKAKESKIGQFRDENGFLFCEDCRKSSGVRFDCSHDISVKECKENKNICVSLAWDIENITIRCRKCHQEWDKNY